MQSIWRRDDLILLVIVVEALPQESSVDAALPPDVRKTCGLPGNALKNSGLRPDFRVQPHYPASVNGGAERFRTPDGGAVTHRLTFEARPVVESLHAAIELRERLTLGK